MNAPEVFEGRSFTPLQWEALRTLFRNDGKAPLAWFLERGVKRKTLRALERRGFTTWNGHEWALCEGVNVVASDRWYVERARETK